MWYCVRSPLCKEGVWRNSPRLQWLIIHRAVGIKPDFQHHAKSTQHDVTYCTVNSYATQDWTESLLYVKTLLLHAGLQFTVIQNTARDSEGTAREPQGQQGNVRGSRQGRPGDLLQQTEEVCNKVITQLPPSHTRTIHAFTSKTQDVTALWLVLTASTHERMARLSLTWVAGYIPR